MLVLSVYADHFLSNIRSSQGPGELIILMNNDGYYLSHPDTKKEYSFSFGADENFFKDYPELSKNNIFEDNGRLVETNDLIFSFKYVYPTLGSFELYEGSKKVFGENSEDNYFWVMVSVSKRSELGGVFLDNLKKSYLTFLILTGIIALAIIVLVYIFIFKTADLALKRKNK